MTSCFKENHKLVGISNFLAWKRWIDIVLEVNEVIDHVHGKVSKPSEGQPYDVTSIIAPISIHTSSFHWVIQTYCNNFF